MKDIEDFYKKAISLYKEKSKEINFSDKDGNSSDNYAKLFALKNEALLVYNRCELMNEEITSNGIYNELYMKSYKKLDKEIFVEEERILQRKRESEKK